MSISSNSMPSSAELFKIADELWQELEEASFIDPPLLLKPFYNKMVKKDEVEFKTPPSMSDKEYNSFLVKVIGMELSSTACTLLTCTVLTSPLGCAIY